jgi:hypothetical protein
MPEAGQAARDRVAGQVVVDQVAVESFMQEENFVDFVRMRSRKLIIKIPMRSVSL